MSLFHLIERANTLSAWENGTGESLVALVSCLRGTFMDSAFTALRYASFDEG